MNFAINARDAMEGKGTLSIKLAIANITGQSCSACHKSISGQWIELSISDTGMGISPGVLERMFEPFFTTKAVGKGSGMGLAVVYGIVHKNQGHILVESDEGKGTTFRILFSANTDHELLVSEDASSLDAPQGDGVEILIVDDEVAYGNFMKKLLDQNGYQAFYINDPKAALQLFMAKPDRFQLVLTDQTMPEMTGSELVKGIRKSKPDIPIILCTGFSEHFTKRDADQMNISFMTKPANTETLLVEISKLIQ